LYDSTHMGFVGTRTAMQASPDFTFLGFSSVGFMVRRSSFCGMDSNLHAMWAVWQSSTGD